MGSRGVVYEYKVQVVLFELLSVLVGLLGAIVLSFVACWESRLVARGWSN